MDLSLEDTDTLLAELGKRFDCFVFGYQRDLNAKEEATNFGYYGSRTLALGLLESFSWMIKRDAASLNTETEEL